MRLMILFLLASVPCLKAFGEDFPNQFSKLLKPSQWVSYSIVENQYLISIASEEAKTMHLKGKTMQVNELIETEPLIADAIQSALQRRDPPRKGYRYSNDTPRFYWESTFRKVLFVGKDYVVLSKTDSEDPYSAIPLRRISLIKWLDVTPRISFSRIQTEIPESEAAENLKPKVEDEPFPVVALESKYQKYAQRIVDRYDKDDDDMISTEEWERMLISPAAADTNKDGKITVQEYGRWMQNRSKK